MWHNSHVHAISHSFITLDNRLELVRERRLYNVSFEFRFYKLQTIFIKVSKGAKIRNRNNQVPHLTQDKLYHYRILVWIFPVAE